VLKSARVENFQSLAVVGVMVDKFTVLVGPSNSGKSAFLRAIRSLVRNTFVPANVRQGETKAITLIYLNGHIISSERGKSLSTYYLEDDPFPKSGKSVPTEIVQALKMPLVGGIDPHFSFQFDRPFLLAESGSTAASVIGSLTNVSVLHAAVREANRRRGGVSSTLKVRYDDKVRLQAQVETYRFLPARKKSIDRARRALQSAEELQASLLALQTATDALEASQRFLDTFTLPEVPDIDLSSVEADIQELKVLEGLTAAVAQGLTIANRYDKMGLHQGKSIAALDDQHQRVLEEAGICPTCGRSIDD
jgi:DNA repair protein SbcC/Rad50